MLPSIYGQIPTKEPHKRAFRALTALRLLFYLSRKWHYLVHPGPYAVEVRASVCSTSAGLRVLRKIQELMRVSALVLQDGVEAPPEEELPSDEGDLDGVDLEDEVAEDTGDLSFAAMFATSALGRMTVDEGGAASGAPVTDAERSSSVASDPQVAAPDAFQRRSVDPPGSFERSRQVTTPVTLLGLARSC